MDLLYAEVKGHYVGLWKTARNDQSGYIPDWTSVGKLPRKISLVAGTRNHLNLRFETKQSIERMLRQLSIENNDLGSLLRCAA